MSAKKVLSSWQQGATNDLENFVVRSKSGIKRRHSPDLTKEIVTNKEDRSTKTQGTQVNIKPVITADDLTSKEPSIAYWQTLATKNSSALEAALKRNEKLKKLLEVKEEELKVYKQMLEEAGSFIEVFKEEIAYDSHDDTGIDVHDVSTSDETIVDNLKTDGAP